MEQTILINVVEETQKEVLIVLLIAQAANSQVVVRKVDCRRVSRRNRCIIGDYIDPSTLLFTDSATIYINLLWIKV